MQSNHESESNKPRPSNRIPRYDSEKTFARNFFDHDAWEYEPRRFQLIESTYTPDFYDARRNVYIEVVGTTKAYSVGKNKNKYLDFSILYPNLSLEFRKPDGSFFTPARNEDEIIAKNRWYSRMFKILEKKGVDVTKMLETLLSEVGKS